MIPIILQKVGITDEEQAREIVEAWVKLNIAGIDTSLWTLATMLVNTKHKQDDLITASKMNALGGIETDGKPT